MFENFACCRTILKTATHQYTPYLKLCRFDVAIRYPTRKLITGRELVKHSNANPFQKGACQRPQASLIPEFMYILPMPRDFLYVVSIAEKFMPELERKIQASMYAHSLLDGDCRCHKNDSAGCFSPPQEKLLSKSALVADLLDRATTAFPFHTYERMEFLGMRHSLPCAQECIPRLTYSIIVS